MTIGLARLGQVARPVRDADISERFYVEALGLRKLFRFGGLCFLDMAGVRLLLDQVAPDAQVGEGHVLYFQVPDIIVTRTALEARGVVFADAPHCVAPMGDHDLWMTFFRDPDNHLCALIAETPKAWRPPG